MLAAQDIVNAKFLNRKREYGSMGETTLSKGGNAKVMSGSL
jgi:hypothetical protein